MSRALLPCCAVLVLVAGFGGKSEAAPSLDGLSVEVVRVVTYPASDPRPPQVESFSLTCDPPAGTLPFAERVCRNIREHPQAMLTPRDLLPPKPCRIPDIPGRSTITFTVLVTLSGSQSELRESPDCRDPGRVGRNIFSAAAYGDEGLIARLEPALRCDEDPVALVFAKLSATNRQACMLGSWTDANRAAIGIAARAPAIAALGPAQLFPTDPGAQSCKIPTGGPVKGRSVKGQCGVYVTGATVTFVEDWSGRELIWHNNSNSSFRLRAGSAKSRHVWEVVVLNGRVVTVAERGAVPPQRRR